MIENLIFEKWKNVQSEVYKEIQEEINSLQESIKNIKKPETYLYIKYHNNDSCMGCYYAEDDYDIVLALPVAHLRFEDMLIFSRIDNNDNERIEVEIRFKKSSYTKKVDVLDKEYVNWCGQLSVRTNEIKNWKKEYIKCESIISSNEGKIKRLERTINEKSIYSESYILKNEQEMIELKKEVVKAKNNTYYNNYVELMKLTNSFSDNIY